MTTSADYLHTYSTADLQDAPN